MKRFALACLAVAALSPAPASAADQRMPTKAPPLAAPPPAISWTGCYIGVNIGGGFASDKYFDPLVPPPDNFLGKHEPSGVVGGGQVGCDYQYGAWVFGARGMFDGADLNDNHFFAGDVFDTHIPWFATATARLGYLVDPTFLLYVKGGGAWKRQEEKIIDGITGLVEATGEKTRTGYDVGGGFEWRFWQLVVLRRIQLPRLRQQKHHVHGAARARRGRRPAVPAQHPRAHVGGGGGRQLAIHALDALTGRRFLRQAGRPCAGPFIWQAAPPKLAPGPGSAADDSCPGAARGTEPRYAGPAFQQLLPAGWQKPRVLTTFA